uniref:Transmembrane protein 229A n=1 Tax=Neogobius melanostomus TaxID=47308 RepID=A0A8C6S9B2_9GOBI
MGSSRRRGAASVRSRAAVMPLQTCPLPVPGFTAQALRDLPRWMRLYFYGMHGVTLDVLLSALQGLFRAYDPKLLGFSSLYLGIAHSLCHLALEKLYAQRKSFRSRPMLFHLVIYPSVYIGLQILIGSVQALMWSSTEVPVPRLSPHMFHGGLSLSQMLLHYILALYFVHVFHRGLSQLQYEPSHVHTVPEGHLPGFLRFLFFGMHGLVDEVVFTSMFNLVEKADSSLSGHTSLWSFLMYGSCSFVVEKLYLHLHFTRGWGTFRRLPLYICVAYTWELSWGLLLRQFGACSWDYSHYPLHFMGLVTLLYLPGWVCLSLYQDVLTNVLLRIKCTKESCNGAVAQELNGQTQFSKKLI